MAEKPLSKLKTGQKGQISKVEGNLRQRFLRMGLVPGEEVTVERVAPLGDPVDILIKGYHLSLRKEEAKAIWVKL